MDVSMNFRLVWVGSDDDPESSQTAHSAAAVPARRSGSTGYEIRGTEMVRRDQLDNGRHKLTALANFTARIVGDLVFDDEVEPRREFAVEAELAGQRFAFVVPVLVALPVFAASGVNTK